MPYYCVQTGRVAQELLVEVIKNVGESDYEECLRFKEENYKNLDWNWK